MKYFILAQILFLTSLVGFAQQVMLSDSITQNPVCYATVYDANDSRGDRHLGYSSRHTQVPVPATTTRAVCPVVPAKTRFYNQSNAENNKNILNLENFP